MLLWILFALLTAGALGAVLSPMFRGQQDIESREVYDVAVYKDQLKELERDVERGLISEQEAKNAKTEISRRLISASDQLEQGKTSGKTHSVPPQAAIALSLVLIPVFSVGLYLAYGTPIPPQASRCLQLTDRFKPSKELEHVKGLVHKVEQRLRKHPNEARGWQAVAPIYLKLQCYHSAVFAYKKALDLLGPSGERLSEYAEALVRANRGRVVPVAQEAFRSALKLEPQRMLPRVRLVLALEQEGKKDQAIKSWTEIYNSKDSTVPLKRMAQSRIEALSGKKIASTKTASADNSDDRKPGNPTAEDIKEARKLSSDDRTAMIQNMVDGLAERLSEDGGSIEEWKRLIRSYKVLGKNDQALKALKDAKENLKSKSGASSELDAFAKQMGLAS